MRFTVLTSFPYFDHDTKLQLHPTFLPSGLWITLADQDRYRVGVAVADPLLGLLGGGNEEHVVVACAIRHQRQCFVPNSITHGLCPACASPFPYLDHVLKQRSCQE